MRRVLLNAKSDFSLLWGTRSPHDVVRKAAQLGYDAVALVDRDNVYALPEFLARAQRHDLRPIVAAEVTDPATSQSALLYPTTQTGYTHLCRVLTERHCREAFDLERALYQYGDGLAIVTDSVRILRRLGDHDQVYVRMGHRLRRPPAEVASLPWAIVPPAVFFDDDDVMLHRLLRAIDLKTRLSAVPPAALEDERSRFEPWSRIASRFAALPEAVAGTERLLDALRFEADFSETVFPDFPCPDGMSVIELLRCKTYEGARRRYGALPDAVASRLEREDPRAGISSYPRARIPSRTHGCGNPFPRGSQDGNPAEGGCEIGISHQDPIASHQDPVARDGAKRSSSGQDDTLRLHHASQQNDTSHEGESPIGSGISSYPRARIPSRTHGCGNPLPRGSQDGNPAGGGCEIGISHQDRGSAGASSSLPSLSLPPVVVARIERELDLIEQKGFAPYFLVVDEIVRRSPRTCGRGSAAASVVSYCLGITNVDPIRHHLMFERFLNPGRTDPPDIDVDFAWDERDEVIEWVLNHYGTDRAAMVANHNRFRPRMALRETARVFGLPEPEISAVTHRLPWGWQTDEADGLEHVVRAAPRMAGVALDPPWAEIIRLAERLIGKPRGLSAHCGGVVLTPGRIWERSPIQPSPKGVHLVHWDKDGVEDLGLVKIDLLGNRSLAVIRDAIANLRAEGVAFDESRWDPIGDPKTQRMLASGRTMGVFYCESPAMRQLQLKTGRGDFEHLVINTSIIRPAANAYTKQYVERVHGVPYEPIHPLLADLLAETYGIMVYQEHVSQVAMAMAGFSCEDADRLRKIMSKKDGHLELTHFYRRFVEGARGKGVGDEVIDEVFRMILAFSGYSFCKPHSASYTMVSYQAAYLKAHHPAAFMAAVMANHGGFYCTQAYVSEARRLGIEVRPPDVNLSEQRFAARQGRIVTGLIEVKGLSLSAQEQILQERDHGGPFAGLDDFLTRTGVGAADAKRLILCGAFDRAEPDKNRPTLLWALKVRTGSGAGRGSTARRGSGGRGGGKSVAGRGDGAGGGSVWPDLLESAGRSDLLESAAEPGLLSSLQHVAQPPSAVSPGIAQPRAAELHAARATEPHAPALRGYDRLETLRLEYERLGFLATAHPLEVFAPRRRGRAWVRAADLADHVGRTVSVLSWPISAKTITTTGNEVMEFVSFEDETALYEAVLFPRPYRRYANLLFCDAPVVVTGQVDEDYGALSVLVDHIAKV